MDAAEAAGATDVREVRTTIGRSPDVGTRASGDDDAVTEPRPESGRGDPAAVLREVLDELAQARDLVRRALERLETGVPASPQAPTRRAMPSVGPRGVRTRRAHEPRRNGRAGIDDW